MPVDKIFTTDLTPQQVGLIIDDLAHLRLIADLELSPRYPDFDGKPYPLGRCKEIRDKVFSLLQERLKKAQQPGLVLIRQQLEKGIGLEKKWGSLRDEYFQNAMVLGDWYIDVSNDTVNPNKPRVEMLPLNEANFSAISSFEQFVKVARPYWGVEVYQNNVLPALAPLLPLICVNGRGKSRLGYASSDMFSLAMNSQFAASKRILSSLPAPPKELADKWRKLLGELPQNDLLLQQGDPLEYCEEYKDKQYYLDKKICERVLAAYFLLPTSL
tara:strand:+ start:168839 stop:169651 length:813 start_codon:yes stop_codon:yes gene_type:complete